MSGYITHRFSEGGVFLKELYDRVSQLGLVLPQWLGLVQGDQNLH